MPHAAPAWLKSLQFIGLRGSIVVDDRDDAPNEQFMLDDRTELRDDLVLAATVQHVDKRVGIYNVQEVLKDNLVRRPFHEQIAISRQCRPNVITGR